MGYLYVVTSVKWAGSALQHRMSAGVFGYYMERHHENQRLPTMPVVMLTARQVNYRWSVKGHCYPLENSGQ